MKGAGSRWMRRIARKEFGLRSARQPHIEPVLRLIEWFIAFGLQPCGHQLVGIPAELSGELVETKVTLLTGRGVTAATQAVFGISRNRLKYGLPVEHDRYSFLTIVDRNEEIVNPGIEPNWPLCNHLLKSH